MKTALLEKLVIGQRSRSIGQAPYSMEFANLLDDITPQPVTVTVSIPDPIRAELDLGLADLVMFPVPRRLDPEPEPEIEQVEALFAEITEPAIEEGIEEEVAAAPKVSRFADTGLDDDLLPLHAPRRRLHR